MGYKVTKCPCYQAGVNEDGDNCFQYGKCQEAKNCPIRRVLTKCHRYELGWKRVGKNKEYYSSEWQSAASALADFSLDIYNILGKVGK